MQQMDYNLLFRWLVGLSMDAPNWDVTVFTKNRERLLAGDVAAKFLAALLSQPRVKALLSDEHFSLDGTLIEAWASMKSFKPKDETDGGDADNSGQRPRHATPSAISTPRSAATQTTRRPPILMPGYTRRPVAKRPSFAIWAMSRWKIAKGLIVDATLTHATGTAEREAALDMLVRMDGRHRITLAADKACDTADFVAALRNIKVTPHVAQNTANRRSAIDGRTTHHPRLRCQSAHPQAYRGSVRLGQDQRRNAQDPPSWKGSCRLDVHPDNHRL